MRRKLLYVILSFFPFVIVAQSLEIHRGNQVLSPGDEITLTTDNNFGKLTLDDIVVVNNTNQSLSILCAREIISEVNQTENSFSWGITGGSVDPSSSISDKIKAGEHSNRFKCDYSPSGNYGVTKVKYIFHDKENPGIRVDFTVNYVSSSESDIFDQKEEVHLSPAYPNPAQNIVTFDYSLQQRNQDSKIVIYDLFGSIIKEIEITEIAGSLKINTSDLTEGIYFYSLLINNGSILTQKLIIKH